MASGTSPYVASLPVGLKMVKTYSQSDHSILLSVEISLHLDKKHPCWEHNHGRDYVDQCKLNSFVMNAAGLAVAQGWEIHSLSGVAKHVLKIADQWELREEETAVNFRTQQSAECSMYPHLADLPGPIQKLMVGQLKKAMEAQDEGESWLICALIILTIIKSGEIPRNLNNELSCTWLFNRQYQLPCSHLWQFNLMSNSFAEADWKRWAYMFEEGGFEIYESAIKEYVTRDIYDEPDDPSKHILDVREVLDEIKSKFYGGGHDGVGRRCERADFRPVNGYVTSNDGPYTSTGCPEGPTGARKRRAQYS